MLNFLGVQYNFTVLAGAPWSSKLNFVHESDGEAFLLSNVTFSGTVVHGEEEIDIAIRSLDSSLNITIPPLPEGRWEFHLTATSETGNNTRMIYGLIYAVEPSTAQSSKTYPSRTLDVRIPDEVSEHILLEWQSTTASQIAAAEAAASATAAARSAEEAASSASSAAESAASASASESEAQQHLADLNAFWGRAQNHTIDSEDDLPADADHCNPYHNYYIVGDDGITTKYIWATNDDGDHGWVGTINIEAVSEALTSHIGDFGSHVSPIDRTNWNGKASEFTVTGLSYTVSGHTSNTDIHISEDEREAWDGKADSATVSGLSATVTSLSTTVTGLSSSTAKFPNITNMYGLVVGSFPYTMPHDGWFYCYMYGSNADASLSINGVMILKETQDYVNASLLLKAGTIISIAHPSIFQAYVAPLMS